MKDIFVYDHFLDWESFNKINVTMNSGYFPWYFSCVTENNKKDEFQFSHLFYQTGGVNSDFCDMLNPLIIKLNATAIARIKANLLLQTKNIKIFDYHTDFDWNHKWWTAIYYVNTNDGKTIFKNSREILSRENRVVIFDGRYEHTGTTCTDEKNRLVINLNYYNKDIK